MVGDAIRRWGFWTLDALKGGHIRSHYRNIKQMNDQGLLNSEQLHDLLKFACSNSSFYSSCDPENLKSFPIMNKHKIIENWEKLRCCDENAEGVHHVHTSGSTGTPFKLMWDAEKRNRQKAELIYYNEKAGQRLGQRFSYLRVWTDDKQKGRLELWMMNLLPIDITHLDSGVLSDILGKLTNGPRVNMCQGYASTFVYLADYIQEQGRQPKLPLVNTIITGSECMTMEQKKRIRETLGCKVYDRYSNEENGFIAQSDEYSDEFIVNTAGFFVEILKQDSDEPADIGEVGRIVITDLYNRAVPVIRYDTGDMSAKVEERDGWVTKLKAIQGRRVDALYDTQGKVLSPLSINNLMQVFDKLRQFQLIQETAREYTLKVNMAPSTYTDEELIAYVRKIVGRDADIRVEHCDEIPTLASGKTKQTVRNYQYDPANYQKQS